MSTLNIDETIKAWTNLNDTLFVPHTEEEYERLVQSGVSKIPII